MVHQRNIIIIDDYYATKLLGVVNTYLAYYEYVEHNNNNATKKMVRNVLFPLGVFFEETKAIIEWRFLDIFALPSWWYRLMSVPFPSRSLFAISRSQSK